MPPKGSGKKKVQDKVVEEPPIVPPSTEAVSPEKASPVASPLRMDRFLTAPGAGPMQQIESVVGEPIESGEPQGSASVRSAEEVLAQWRLEDLRHLHRLAMEQAHRLGTLAFREDPLLTPLYAEICRLDPPGAALREEDPTPAPVSLAPIVQSAANPTADELALALSVFLETSRGIGLAETVERLTKVHLRSTLALERIAHAAEDLCLPSDLTEQNVQQLDAR